MGLRGISDALAVSTGLPETFPVVNLSVCDGSLYVSGKLNEYGIRSSAIAFHSVGSACGVVKYVSTAEAAEIGAMYPDIIFGYDAGFPYTHAFATKVLCGSEKLGISRFYSTFFLSASGPTITSYTPQPKIITLCDTDLPVSPKFILFGPGELNEITNQTYGFSLYFDYTLVANEILFIDLATSPPTIQSNINGDVLKTMLPASTPGAFKLYPGDNSIIVKSLWGVTADTTFVVQYTRQALAAETLCCDCFE